MGMPVDATLRMLKGKKVTTATSSFEYLMLESSLQSLKIECLSTLLCENPQVASEFRMKTHEPVCFLVQTNIGCFLKRFSINVKKKCKNK